MRLRVKSKEEANLSVTAEKCLLLSAQMHSGLCTLTGVREKPGGREKANRRKKEKGEVEGEEEKKKKEEKRKKGEEKRRYIRPVRLRVCVKITPARRRRCPPQASLFLKGTVLCTK